MRFRRRRSFHRGRGRRRRGGFGRRRRGRAGRLGQRIGFRM